MNACVFAVKQITLDSSVEIGSVIEMGLFILTIYFYILLYIENFV